MAHRLNVQFIADSIGRLVWISPPLPGVRHDMGTARDYAIIETLTAHEIPVVADTAYQGADPRVAVPRPPSASRPGHWPLPAPGAQPEGGQRRTRPPTRARVCCRPSGDYPPRHSHDLGSVDRAVPAVW